MKGIADGFVRDSFTIWEEPLDGVHHPEDRWNGWACPYLTLESVAKVEAWMAECVANKEVDSDEGPRIVDGEVFYVEVETGRRDVIAPTFFEGFTFINEDGEECYEAFYDVGRYGWTYDVAPK